MTADHHGVRVRDPFRWLEDAESDETTAWVEAQNRCTFALLDSIPERASIRKRLAQIWNEPHVGVPSRRGPWWFEFRHDGIQNQEVLFVGPAADDGSPPAADRYRTLLDVNALSADGTVSITNLSLSQEGGLLAYGLSEAGSDWVTWRVRNVATGDDLEDTIRWSKFGSLGWLPGSTGFVYTSYDPPEPGTEFAAASHDQRLRLHLLGTSPERDPIVHEEPEHPDWSFEPLVTHDGRWLVVSVWEGGLDSNRIFLAAIDGEQIGIVRPLLSEAEAHFECLGAVGQHLLFLTNDAAPMGRVIAVDPDHAARSSWVEMVQEGRDRLGSARLVAGAAPGDRGWILLHRWHDATSRLSSVSLEWSDGSVRKPHEDAAEIPLPEVLASVPAFTCDREDGRFHLQLETFLSPSRVFYGDLSRTPGESGAIELHSRAPLGGAGSERDESGPELIVEQVFVEHGGVRVPVFLLHREDVRPTGDVPTILYGYGGFDVATTPSYSVPWRVWTERGGLVAVACLRGGGEYGKTWHDAGRTPNKQNVFDDAIAVAKWLNERWTSRDRLGIHGRSNGGLLVGACMTQHPDLFGACIPEVGVMDMLRFHLFTIGWAWVSDYGSADDREQFRELYAYSPLHNLREGCCYPPTLITTGDHDDRVVPGHSFKFAAALQAAQGCDHPVLIRVDVAAGHGAGKPLVKRIDERADVLAFLAHHLGMTERI